MSEKFDSKQQETKKSEKKEKKSQQTTPTFETLPKEALICLLTFLTPPELCNVAMTCKKFRTLASEDQFWVC
jgi:hypothetical protein